ncbi:MAG: AbrB/MazE/SpoVT family DNA-binding domain-containing protein [Actinobacteria bacterium]|nr:AbrB/MazE/SpoVT family DNA-binding domain-containing protein [Actinomycetota bacterium]
MALTISSKGWVVIPVEFRKKYGLKAGDAVNIVDYGGVLALVPVLEDPVIDARGMLLAPESVTAELVDEHRQEVARNGQRKSRETVDRP